MRHLTLEEYGTESESHMKEEASDNESKSEKYHFQVEVLHLTEPGRELVRTKYHCLDSS